MLTTWRNSTFPSPVEGGSSPSNLAVSRSASISCLTRWISCSFIRSTSKGFFMGEGSLNNQHLRNNVASNSKLPPENEKHHEGTCLTSREVFQCRFQCPRW